MPREPRDFGIRRHYGRSRRETVMGSVDVLYVACNRREYTEWSFANLLAHTNWELVRQLVVYDDGSVDGTLQYLEGALRKFGGSSVIVETKHGSCVQVMNDYVNGTDSERFAKIDNDIVVPPGWLEAMVATMDTNPHVDILGMESGRMGIPPGDHEGLYGVEEARWIGGVGLMRTAALGERPQMTPNGRFGWTEWQREYRSVVKAWITPDLAVTELSKMPFEPWLSLSADYVSRDWDREFGKYHPHWGKWYWGWWPTGAKGEEG